MRQSKNKKREVTAALYVRLSRDDNLEGDSYSIGNQKKLLTKIAKEKGYYIPAQQATPEEVATVKQQVSQG